MNTLSKILLTITALVIPSAICLARIESPNLIYERTIENNAGPVFPNNPVEVPLEFLYFPKHCNLVLETRDRDETHEAYYHTSPIPRSDYNTEYNHRKAWPQEESGDLHYAIGWYYKGEFQEAYSFIGDKIGNYREIRLPESVAGADGPVGTIAFVAKRGDELLETLTTTQEKAKLAIPSPDSEYKMELSRSRQQREEDVCFIVTHGNLPYLSSIVSELSENELNQALRCAAREGRTDIAKLLIQYGANPFKHEFK